VDSGVECLAHRGWEWLGGRVGHWRLGGGIAHWALSRVEERAADEGGNLSTEFDWGSSTIGGKVSDHFPYAIIHERGDFWGKDTWSRHETLGVGRGSVAESWESHGI
jgi:hypothetical protein